MALFSLICQSAISFTFVSCKYMSKFFFFQPRGHGKLQSSASFSRSTLTHSLTHSPLPLPQPDPDNHQLYQQEPRSRLKQICNATKNVFNIDICFFAQKADNPISQKCLTWVSSLYPVTHWHTRPPPPIAPVLSPKIVSTTGRNHNLFFFFFWLLSLTPANVRVFGKI